MLICPACRATNDEGAYACKGCEKPILPGEGFYRRPKTDPGWDDDSGLTLDIPPPTARGPAWFLVGVGLLIVAGIVLFVGPLLSGKTITRDKPKVIPDASTWDGRALAVAQTLNYIHDDGCKVSIEYAANADPKPAKLVGVMREATRKAKTTKGRYIVGAAYHVGSAPKDSKLRVYDEGVAKKPTWVGTLVVVWCAPGQGVGGA